MKIPYFEAKINNKDSVIQGFYVEYPETTYCFSNDYITHPVKMIPGIITYSMSDWGLPNQLRYCEVASGMNENRTEFNKMLDSILNNEVANVFITYKDRLSRFGLDYFENIFKKFDCKITTLNNKINEENFEHELTQDIIAIIHHFSMKLYSSRRNKLKEIQKLLT